MSEPTENFRDDERLRKEERLLERSEYKRLQRSGTRRTGRHFIVYGLPNGREWSRLGLIASRKVGNAIARNWWKRRIREIFRRNKKEFPSGHDFIVIVKASTERDDYEALEEELIGLFNQAATTQT